MLNEQIFRGREPYPVAQGARPDAAQNLRGAIRFKLLAMAQYGTCHG